jgi:hypothetical protein
MNARNVPINAADAVFQYGLIYVGLLSMLWVGVTPWIYGDVRLVTGKSSGCVMVERRPKPICVPSAEKIRVGDRIIVDRRDSEILSRELISAVIPVILLLALTGRIRWRYGRFSDGGTEPLP